MPDIAEITAPSTGAEKKNDEGSSWISAPAGTKLQFGNHVRIASGNYTVRLYAGAVIDFGSVQTVTVSDNVGACLYCNADGNWVEINDDGNISCQAVGTGPGGGISITCGAEHAYPPPPWPPKQ